VAEGTARSKARRRSAGLRVEHRRRPQSGRFNDGRRLQVGTSEDSISWIVSAAGLSIVHESSKTGIVSVEYAAK